MVIGLYFSLFHLILLENAPRARARARARSRKRKKQEAEATCDLKAGDELVARRGEKGTVLAAAPDAGRVTVAFDREGAEPRRVEALYAEVKLFPCGQLLLHGSFLQNTSSRLVHR